MVYFLFFQITFIQSVVISADPDVFGMVLIEHTYILVIQFLEGGPFTFKVVFGIFRWMPEYP